MASKQRLLIDFSGDSDQAIGLLYALQSPKVQVSGIIVSDAEPDRGIQLARRLVDQVRPGEEIPVMAGTQQPLFRGEADRAADSVMTSEAVTFLTELVPDPDNPLTLVTLGRLTTVAKAIARKPEWLQVVQRIVVRGGAIRVPGDVTAIAEANLHADPEAAAFVLAAKGPLLFVPLDATESLGLTDEQAALLAKTVRGTTATGKAGTVKSVLGAMIAAVAPEQIETERLKLSIDCHSLLSRGALIADLRAKPSAGTDADVCVAIQSEAIETWVRQLTEGEDRA